MLIKKLLPFLILTSVSFSQVVHEPLPHRDIYAFLENQSLKELIKFKGEIKPVPRILIAAHLKELHERRELLSSLEVETLNFFIEEYGKELRTLGMKINDTGEELTYFRKNRYGRIHAFYYEDNFFTLKADPVAGYNIGSDNYKHRWGGLQLSGYIGENIGFNLNFRDYGEFGDLIDEEKLFTHSTGVIVGKRINNGIEYSEVRGNVSASWNWGAFTLGKDFMEWGNGRGGQLILSTKAPSFPFIRLDVSPVEWLRFTYIHGWLNSGLIDSSSIRHTSVEFRPTYDDIPKFIAAHIVSFDLFSNLTLSLGESIIYSDKIEPIYLIPVMFFRLADHYLGNNESNTGDNAQIFADASYILHPLRTKLYGTLFIDEMSVYSLLEGSRHYIIGYTLGFETADPVLKNSTFTFEFSRLTPFMYMNSNDAQTYRSSNYQLGHWIGSNGEHLYVNYHQRIFRGLSVNLRLDLVRKGENEDPELHYSTTNYPPILYGRRLSYSSYQLGAQYEIIHDLFVKTYYQYSDISDEDKLRTPDWQLGKKHQFGLAVYYGL
jgi:hypothetical protein